MNVYFNNRFLLAFILAILVPVDYVFAEIQHLFNRQGTQYTIPKGKFPKWDDMLKRWNKTQGLVDNDCQSGLFNSCYLRELETLIADIKKEPEWHKINEINGFVNQMRYQEDIYVYGISDYWAIPHEFFDNEWGDCEDYSLTKYYALKALGLKSSDMQIAVVKDININVHHAILIVNYKDEHYVLDNRLSDVIKLKRLKHYQPVYTINEQYWWFYH
ncbi:MAG: transglutaminase-like cysteine peptidase [Methylococcales bacterium]|nr:transglutaminase-like cysteine peptidase [Methylococcales bacterium]